MAMTSYSGDPEVISKLGTTPQERGLETQQFKAKFDEGLKEFTEWFNATHKTEFELVQTDLATHLAENVYLKINATRDLSLDGVQTISGSPFKPKHINIKALINGNQKFSIGDWAESGNQGVLIYSGGYIGTTDSNVIFIAETIGSANYVTGTISNVTDTSFDITWAKSGTPPTGAVDLKITIGGHY